ncbi:MAG: 4a-hydroxytetrahydrobiopterin dehydratase [Thermoanaerobaculia bacterium]
MAEPPAPSKRPAAAGLSQLTSAIEPLKAERIQLLLKEVPRWQLAKDGASLGRAYHGLPSLRAALLLASLAAEVAEQHHHAAALDIRGGRVTVTLTSPEAGGLTEKDFEVAAALDRIG